MMAPKQPFRFDAWLSYSQPKTFWHQLNSGNFEKTGVPIWSSGLYDLNFEISDENVSQQNITFMMDDNQPIKMREMYSKNKTSYLYFQIMTPDIYSP